MIQRLQTIYLVLITILMILTFFMPLGVYSDGNVSYLITIFGYNEVGSTAGISLCTWPLPILAGVTVLLAFSSIFLYKKRKVQIKLSNLSSLLIFLFYMAFIYYAYDFRGGAEEMNLSFKAGLVFPIVSLLIYYAAIRKIKADEELVRSLDRLR